MTLTSNQYFQLPLRHSLGAMVAACLTVMWQDRFKDRVVRSIGYGSLGVFSPSTPRQLCSNIVSVIHKGDPFRCCSFGHIIDDLRILSILCQNRPLREEVLMSRDIEFCAKAMAYLRKERTAVKLVPPGTVYQIEGSLWNEPLREETTIESVDPIIFNERVWHARTFDLSFHAPLRYKRILHRLVSSKIGRRFEYTNFKHEDKNEIEVKKNKVGIVNILPIEEKLEARDEVETIL